MVSSKVHICIIDNGVFQKDFNLYRDMEIVGREIRSVTTESDEWSHGSACANVIKKSVTRSYEMSSITILDSSGKGEIDSLLLALEWCKNNAVDIANLSLGSTYFKDKNSLQKMINQCVRSGMTIVAALSNAGYVTYPAGFTNVIAVRKSDVLNKQEYHISFTTGLGFGVVETCGSDTIFVDGQEHETRSSNSIATPYVTSRIADIYFKNINPLYIRRFFEKERFDINCFYVDWVENAYIDDDIYFFSEMCNFCVTGSLDNSDTVILIRKDKIEHYLSLGKNILFLENAELRMSNDCHYIWSSYNRRRQIELNTYSGSEDIEIPIVFVQGSKSLNIVWKLCQYMTDKDHNAYGITDDIIGELYGLRYVPLRKKDGLAVKKYICSEIFYGQYDILICDINNYSKEDIEAEIGIQSDVFVIIDGAMAFVYSEVENRSFSEYGDTLGQYIVELLTREEKENE
ncbi:MAG: S8 family serine peptidase [Lachnospiraceae bacterium]|nr:S8 family serine peptidase [Lachnospiraceae bacterium]